MALIKMFLPIIIVGTIFLTLIMLPVYFISKKRNPDDSKNTILRLIILAFLATTIMTLLLGSGLIMMYFDDLKG
ncbi:MAG: hypothetical protein ACI4I6_06245 [Hominimerdicola sp.]